MSKAIQEIQKSIKGHFFKIILVMLFVLSLGYVMLFDVATWEAPILGNTFHIVFGLLFMIIAVISIVISIKIRFFQKKKRRSSRPVFLRKQ